MFIEISGLGCILAPEVPRVNKQSFAQEKTWYFKDFKDSWDNTTGVSLQCHQSP